MPSIVGVFILHADPEILEELKAKDAEKADTACREEKSEHG